MSGFTREEFAEKLGVQIDTYLNIEAGKDIVPARFDDAVEPIVDAALFALDDPGPGDLAGEE